MFYISGKEEWSCDNFDHYNGLLNTWILSDRSMDEVEPINLKIDPT